MRNTRHVPNRHACWLLYHKSFSCIYPLTSNSYPLQNDLRTTSERPQNDLQSSCKPSGAHFTSMIPLISIDHFCFWWTWQPWHVPLVSGEMKWSTIPTKPARSRIPSSRVGYKILIRGFFPSSNGHVLCLILSIQWMFPCVEWSEKTAGNMLEEKHQKQEEQLYTANRWYQYFKPEILSAFVELNECVFLDVIGLYEKKGSPKPLHGLTIKGGGIPLQLFRKDKFQRIALQCRVWVCVCVCTQEWIFCA